MIITKAGKADTLTIFRIAEASGYPVPELAFDERQIRQMFDEKKIILIAKEAGEAVGYIAIDPRPETRAEIHSIEVRKAHHHKGIGEALLKEAEKRIGVMGKDEIFLYVHPRNRASMLFFTAEGYEKKGLAPDYYSTGEPAVVFSKKMTSSAG